MQINIYLDGGYKLFLNQLFEYLNSKNEDYNSEKFLCPIRKINNVEFTRSEIDFNNQFGGFRSTIDPCFGDFANIFKFFGPKSGIWVVDLNEINLKYRFC